jgi:hypothetical protein
MKWMFLVFQLLTIPAIGSTSDNVNAIPPANDVEKPEQLRQSLRRISENVLPNSGGDALFFRDIKNSRIGIGTVTPSDRLDVDSMTVTGRLYRKGTTIIMQSPDGSCSACGPSNADIWACSSVTCP